jgi:uncharacterized protein (TIGR02996 family)
MSHDAFLRAIIDRPEDDLPRLVYADYLDDVGDHLRAEFIRVQCELAGLPEDDPRRPPLEDREHELLSEHEPVWLGDNRDARDTDRLVEWEFRRGFLDEISLCDWSLGELGPRLFAAHPITGWRFTRRGWRDHEDCAELSGSGWPDLIRRLDLSAAFEAVDFFEPMLTSDCLPGLRSLDLSHCPGIGQIVGVLSRSPFTGRLSSVAFGGRSGVGFRWGDAENETLDVARFNEATRASELEHLAAFDCGLTNSGLHWMLAAPYAAHLKSLDISDNPIAPDAWRAFRPGRTGMRLRRLDVSGTPLAGISLEPLLDSPTLEELSELEMNRCGSARKNMEVLAASGFWTRATHLRAHSGTIPASTLEPLCRSAGPPGLRLLDLADNYLRTEGVRMLCEAPWSGSLTWLALSRNYLDDESVAVLADSGRFTKLRTLHLAHNNLDQDRSDGEEITHRGAAALAAAPSLASLRVLTVSFTGITDRSVEMLLDAPYWRLSGLGLGGCGLSPDVVRMLAGSPRLARLQWLDLSGNPRLSGAALLPLAESPHLSRLCELDVGSICADEKTRQALRGRLGPRLSE